MVITVAISISITIVKIFCNAEDKEELFLKRTVYFNPLEFQNLCFYNSFFIIFIDRIYRQGFATHPV